VKQLIYSKARQLGFDDCKVTSAAPPETSAKFQSWLAAGCHGTMGYLERNAAKRINPDEVLQGAKSVITLAASYYCEEEQNASDQSAGMIARYARFKDYHDVLGERLKQLTNYIGDIGGTETRSLWYVDTGPFLERDLAQRAGLGFVGKHTNVVSRKLGNWFFIAEILTTLELESDTPEKNRCGSCTRCISVCPTRAIDAPFHLDARKCISYLTIELKGSIPEELRPAIGNRIYGCDECLAACPWNRFAQSGKLMLENRREDLTLPDLLELLSLDDAAFKHRFAGTPMLRTKRRGLLRNVCVALGNSGDEKALPALEQALQDKEPLIVEHAAWAIRQIRIRTGEESAIFSQPRP
jgi:epoxyqueuosine reductase